MKDSEVPGSFDIFLLKLLLFILPLICHLSKYLCKVLFNITFYCLTWSELINLDNGFVVENCLCGLFTCTRNPADRIFGFSKNL